MEAKQQEFLWIVQTCLLANAINLSSGLSADKYRHEISATGMYGNADDAMTASKMIPAWMTASEAAHEFVFFMCSNLRDDDEATDREATQCPAWFSRS